MGAVVKACVDYDHTLVDGEKEWLPGAKDGLRWLRRQGYEVVIHSSRANWDGGVEEIRAKLATATFKTVRIEPKPLADLYIGDNYLNLDGGWPGVIQRVRQLA